MTLTLQPFEDVKKEDYICVVDLDEKITNLIKDNTDRKIEEITHWLDPEATKNKPFEERMTDVENLLKKYQGAHLVITNRLHVALPCLALGTKVLLIHDEYYEADRLGTYLKYLNSFTDKEFTNSDIKNILENPKDNKEDYTEIRNNLIEKCEQFIHKCECEEMDNESLPEIEDYNKYAQRIEWYKNLHELIRVKTRDIDFRDAERYKEYRELLKKNNEEWKAKYENLEEQFKNIKSEHTQSIHALEEINNSRIWKLRNKLRKVLPKKGE